MVTAMKDSKRGAAKSAQKYEVLPAVEAVARLLDLLGDFREVLDVLAGDRISDVLPVTREDTTYESTLIEAVQARLAHVEKDLVDYMTLRISIAAAKRGFDPIVVHESEDGPRGGVFLPEPTPSAAQRLEFMESCTEAIRDLVNLRERIANIHAGWLGRQVALVGMDDARCGLESSLAKISVL